MNGVYRGRGMNGSVPASGIKEMTAIVGEKKGREERSLRVVDTEKLSCFLSGSSA